MLQGVLFPPYSVSGDIRSRGIPPTLADSLRFSPDNQQSATPEQAALKQGTQLE